MSGEIHSVWLFSFSRVSRDPRVLRQLEWLRELGFQEIITVGLGPKPSDADFHHEIAPVQLMGRLLNYLLLDRQTRFENLYGDQLTGLDWHALRVASLIVINEIEFLPWIGFRDPAITRIPTYLDLHEDHIAGAHRNMLERLAFARYNRWQFDSCRNFVFSRKAVHITTVSDEIAQSYEQTFSREVKTLVNAPAANSLLPKKTSARAIKLVHHGMGTSGKGIEVAIKAMRHVEERYDLTLILFASPAFRAKLRIIAKLWGVSDRVSLRRGVPLDRLSETLNDFDLEVMLFSNLTQGLLRAFPNKMFEAVHAKLGIICGPNPSISRFVREHQVGRVTEDWEPKSLAKVLNELGSDEIEEFKRNTLAVSKRFSSELNGEELTADLYNLLQARA